MNTATETAPQAADPVRAHGGLIACARLGRRHPSYGLCRLDRSAAYEGEAA